MHRPVAPPRPAACVGWRRRAWLQTAALGGLGLAGLRASAQGIELVQLKLRRSDGDLLLDYQVRLPSGGMLEEALRRGVPLYFTAHAEVLRDRWYWRDERIARQSRTWRVAYQPLTAAWRVGLGGLAQTHPSMAAALEQISRASGWRLVDTDRLEPGARHHVAFSFQLDTQQLPPPMQVGLGDDWRFGVEGDVRLD